MNINANNPAATTPNAHKMNICYILNPTDSKIANISASSITVPMIAKDHRENEHSKPFYNLTHNTNFKKCTFYFKLEKSEGFDT